MISTIQKNNQQYVFYIASKSAQSPREQNILCALLLGALVSLGNKTTIVGMYGLIADIRHAARERKLASTIFAFNL